VNIHTILPVQTILFDWTICKQARGLVSKETVVLHAWGNNTIYLIISVNKSKVLCKQSVDYPTILTIQIIQWDLNDKRDSFRKAREAHIIHKAKTLEPLGINKRDEL